jgi:hypothetical protein
MNVDLIIQAQEVALLAARLAFIGTVPLAQIDSAIDQARQTLKRGQDRLKEI